MKYFILTLLFCFSLTACSQSNPGRTALGKKYAEEELKTTLTEKGLHNLVDNKSNIIKDEATAIKVVETILFGVYGEDNITKQQPYEIYLINNYWVMTGTLPIYSMGGTFLIIIDARTSTVIRITHGK